VVLPDLAFEPLPSLLEGECEERDERRLHQQGKKQLPDEYTSKQGDKTSAKSDLYLHHCEAFFLSIESSSRARKPMTKHNRAITMTTESSTILTGSAFCLIDLEDNERSECEAKDKG
jgi:hypothetical protein